VSTQVLFDNGPDAFCGSCGNKTKKVRLLQMRQDWSSLVRLAKSSPEEPIQSLGKQY
jgi:hypothetical protein